MQRTVAFLADVHGNALALDAVLADLAVRAPGATTVNLGDNVNGPLEPQRSGDLLRARVTVHVRGNGDRMTAAGGQNGSSRFAAARIDAATRDWLGALPLAVQGDGWLACHGSPTDDTYYLLEHVAAGGVELRDSAGIAAALGPARVPVIACGHTHVPRVVRLATGQLVVNPGSVGLAAYADATPFPHRMEAGSPHARYALVHFRDEGGVADVELRCVTYDWESAARQAEENDHAAWARALRTGRA